jgi:hypothetical protein
VANVTAAMCSEELARKKLDFGGYSDGVPVFWLRLNAHSKQDADVRSVERAAVYLMEREILPRLRPHLPGPAGESFLLVADASQFTRNNLDLEAARQLVQTFQQFYPERLHTALVVAPSKLFLAAWKMFFRGWLDPRTAEKVTFIHLEEVDEWLPKDSMAV